MKDTIERQAAIDVLNSFDVLDGHTDKEEIKERIERLPSAQPTFDARDTQYNLPIGTDLISRAEAIDIVDGWFKRIGLNGDICLDGLRQLPSAEPKRETTTLRIGRTRNSVTMWYECAECGEPVDQEDAFCRRCGRGIIHE